MGELGLAFCIYVKHLSQRRRLSRFARRKSAILEREGGYASKCHVRILMFRILFTILIQEKSGERQKPEAVAQSKMMILFSDQSYQCRGMTVVAILREEHLNILCC